MARGLAGWYVYKVRRDHTRAPKYIFAPPVPRGVRDQAVSDILLEGEWVEWVKHADEWIDGRILILKM
jgi:hypothetical protein